MKDVKIYENASVLIEDGHIVAVGDGAEWAKTVPVDKQIDATGKTVLPGFVDSHTHFVFGGYRADEFLWRMEGMTYMEIMERGGGINNTMKATRNASAEELIEHSMDILEKMLAFGITTVEGKSGYGMDHDTELKQLEVMKGIGTAPARRNCAHLHGGRTPFRRNTKAATKNSWNSSLRK